MIDFAKEYRKIFINKSIEDNLDELLDVVLSKDLQINKFIISLDNLEIDIKNKKYKDIKSLNISDKIKDSAVLFNNLLLDFEKYSNLAMEYFDEIEKLNIYTYHSGRHVENLKYELSKFILKRGVINERKLEVLPSSIEKYDDFKKVTEMFIKNINDIKLFVSNMNTDIELNSSNRKKNDKNIVKKFISKIGRNKVDSPNNENLEKISQLKSEITDLYDNIFRLHIEAEAYCYKYIKNDKLNYKDNESEEIYKDIKRALREMNYTSTIY